MYKKLLTLFLILSACHKTTAPPSTQNTTPPAPSSGITIEYRCYCSHPGMKVQYQYRDQATGSWSTVNDSIGLAYKAYTFQSIQGSPNQFTYDAWVLANSSADSVRCEIYKDGILQATNRDQYSVWTYYHY